jgi:phosphate starvation-inducible protein PhoH
MSRRKTNLQLIQDDETNNKKGNNRLIPRLSDLDVFDPLTPTQKAFFDAYNSSTAILLHGSAGTGKTFIALYKAIEEILEKSNTFNKVVVCRSAVASRDIGHLPGNEMEKTEVFMRPYIDMCQELFPDKQQAFERLQEAKKIDWMITSFVRGITLDDAIIIVDECQNMNDMELNSIMTRIGQRSKIIFAGDFKQSDLYTKRTDMSGLQKFMVIAEMMPSFKIFEFTPDDIVRSDLVKEYIIAREKYEQQYS